MIISKPHIMLDTFQSIDIRWDQQDSEIDKKSKIYDVFIIFKDSKIALYTKAKWKDVYNFVFHYISNPSKAIIDEIQLYDKKKHIFSYVICR